MPACLITYLTALRGCLKGISNATWSNRCIMSPRNTYSSSSVSSLSDDGTNCPVVTQPQIYETSLMLSSPSPQWPIHHPVRLLLSTEHLFNPSTSLHIPWLLLAPALLVSHLSCYRSHLASFSLAPIVFSISHLILFYFILFYFIFYTQYYSALVSDVQHSRQSRTL